MSSRILLPLRTTIEPIGSVKTPKSSALARQASILFDEVVVEGGMEIVDVGDDGLISHRHELTGQLTKGVLQAARRVSAGVSSSVGIRRTDDSVELLIGTGVPREAVAFERRLVDRLLAEYHTEVLDPLARLGADWVRVIEVFETDEGREVSDCRLEEIPDGDVPPDYIVVRLSGEQAVAFGEALANPAPVREGVATAAPDLPSQANEALAQAAEIAHSMRAGFVVSGAVAGEAMRRGLPLAPKGSAALGLVVPNVGGLPWDAIAEFREHPGAAEAREMLASFEADAQRLGPAESLDYFKSTASATTSALVAATQEYAPRLPEDLRSALLGSAVGFIPVVGNAASLALSVGDVVAAARQGSAHQDSWLAAIFELRSQAIAAAADAM